MDDEDLQHSEADRMLAWEAIRQHDERSVRVANDVALKLH
jgi:hypothetical protein